MNLRAEHLLGEKDKKKKKKIIEEIRGRVGRENGVWTRKSNIVKGS